MLLFFLNLQVDTNKCSKNIKFGSVLSFDCQKNENLASHDYGIKISHYTKCEK